LAYRDRTANRRRVGRRGSKTRHDRNARTHLSAARRAAAGGATILMALLRRRLDQLIDAHSSVGASYVTYDVTARGSEAENSPGLRLVAVGPDVC